MKIREICIFIWEFTILKTLYTGAANSIIFIFHLVMLSCIRVFFALLPEKTLSQHTRLLSDYASYDKTADDDLFSNNDIYIFKIITFTFICGLTAARYFHVDIFLFCGLYSWFVVFKVIISWWLSRSRWLLVFLYVYLQQFCGGRGSDTLTSAVVIMTSTVTLFFCGFAAILK